MACSEPKTYGGRHTSRCLRAVRKLGGFVSLLVTRGEHPRQAQRLGGLLIVCSWMQQAHHCNCESWEKLSSRAESRGRLALAVACRLHCWAWAAARWCPELCRHVCGLSQLLKVSQTPYEANNGNVL